MSKVLTTRSEVNVRFWDQLQTLKNDVEKNASLKRDFEKDPLKVIKKYCDDVSIPLSARKNVKFYTFIEENIRTAENKKAFADRLLAVVGSRAPGTVACLALFIAVAVVLVVVVGASAKEDELRGRYSVADGKQIANFSVAKTKALVKISQDIGAEGLSVSRTQALVKRAVLTKAKEPLAAADGEQTLDYDYEGKKFRFTFKISDGKLNVTHAEIVEVKNASALDQKRIESAIKYYYTDKKVEEVTDRLKSLKTRVGRNKGLAELLEKNPKEFARKEMAYLMVPMGRNGEMKSAYEYVKNLTDNEANQFIRSVVDKPGTVGLVAVLVVAVAVAAAVAVYTWTYVSDKVVGSSYSCRFVVAANQLRAFKAGLEKATSRTFSVSRANALLKRISIKAPAAAEVRGGEALVRTVNYNYAGKDIKVVCTVKDNVFTVTSTEIK